MRNAGSWFRHPNLLLLATRVGLDLLPARADGAPHDDVVVGRWVSAIAAAAAVDVLALVCLSLAGSLAAVVAALLLGTSPLLYDLAHYMKEDPLLLLGVACFLLALVRFDAAPSRRRLALMGAAAGLAMSAKYIGAVTIPIALGLLIWKGRRIRGNWWKDGLVVVGWALAVFLAVDLPILGAARQAMHSVTAEMQYLVIGHGWLVTPFCSPYYVSAMVRLCSPIIPIAYGLAVLRLIRRGTPATAAQVIVLAFPLAYLAMLQLTPTKIIRYELPVVMVMTMLAAGALAGLMSRERAWPVRGAAALTVAAVLGFNLSAIAASHAAFANDTRAEMARWIAAHLPADAVIAEDRVAGLVGGEAASSGPGRVPMTVMDQYLAAAFGSPATLAASGVTYVLVTDAAFGPLLDPTAYVDLREPWRLAEIEHNRAFYRALFRTGMLVHQIPDAGLTGTAASPGLWLFRVAPAPDDASRPHG